MIIEKFGEYKSDDDYFIIKITVQKDLANINQMTQLIEIFYYGGNE